MDNKLNFEFYITCLCKKKRPKPSAPEAAVHRFSSKKGVRNFTKFTGKHLYQGLLFDKIAGLRPFFFLFIILRRYRFLIYKFTSSTMNINSYTN